jgi:hypothetical protein
MKFEKNNGLYVKEVHPFMLWYVSNLKVLMLHTIVYPWCLLSVLYKKLHLQVLLSVLGTE